MTQEKGNSTALIAGILFAILAALRIFLIHFSIINILWIIGIAVTSYSLIAKRRDIVLCAGFAVFAILSLRSAVLVHSNSSIFSWLDTLAFISATLICIAEFTDYIPQLKGVGKKVWFVPAILVGLSIFRLFSPGYSLFMNFLESILWTAAVLLSMMWVVSVPVSVAQENWVKNKLIPVLVIIAIAVAILIGINGFGNSSYRGNTDTCTICGKIATHTFQGSGYCDNHYEDAINWALTHPKK